MPDGITPPCVRKQLEKENEADGDIGSKHDLARSAKAQVQFHGRLLWRQFLPDIPAWASKKRDARIEEQQCRHLIFESARICPRHSAHCHAFSPADFKI
jgi:hypothetical protein